MGGAGWGVQHLVACVGVDGPSSRELWPVVVVTAFPRLWASGMVGLWPWLYAFPLF